VEVPKDLDGGAELKDRLLVTEDALARVTELANVLGCEEKVPIVRRLPRPRSQELVQNPLVGPTVSTLRGKRGKRTLGRSIRQWF
jgi:hypothetical protein